MYGGDDMIEFRCCDQSITMIEQGALEALHVGHDLSEADDVGPVEDLALWAVALLDVVMVVGHSFASGAFKTRSHVSTLLSFARGFHGLTDLAEARVFVIRGGNLAHEGPAD